MRQLFSPYDFSDDLISELLMHGHQVDVPMGQFISCFDGDIPYFSILLSGRLRHIVNHTNPDSNPFTLAFYRPPYICGLASYNSSSNYETLYASEDSILLTFNASSLFTIRDNFLEFSDFLDSLFTPADLWPLLLKLPDFSIDLPPNEFRVWIDNLLQSAQIFHVSSDKPLLVSRSVDRHFFSLDPSYIAYGSPIPSSDIPHFHAILEHSIRVVSLPKELNISCAPQQDSGQSSSTIAVPTSISSHEATNIPDTSTDSFSHDSTEFPFRFFDSPPGKVLEALACIRTIGDILNLPIKVDLLKRLLDEQTPDSKSAVPLKLCSAIFESLGLKTQLLNLPLHLLSRIKSPSLLLFKDDELVVLLAVKPDKFLISRPLHGITSLSLQEVSLLSPEPDILPLLTLSKTHRTPQKRFTFKWFFPVLKKHKKPLIEVLIASLFVQIFVLMNPLIIQQIIDKVIGQNAMSTLPVLAVLLFSFSVFENILTAVRTNLFIDTTNRIDITLGELVIDHLLRLPLSYFDKRPVGELSSRLGELEQIRSFLTGTALTVIIDSLFSFLYIIVMLFYSWVLTIVSLLVAPILAFITFSISPVIRSQLRSKANLNALTQNHLIEVLTGIQTVKAQNFEVNARWRWKQRYSDYIAEGYKNAVTSTTANGFTQFLNQASSLSVLCVGSYLVLKGSLTLGQLIAFRIISGYVTAPLLRLSNLYQSFQRTSISLERLADIIDTPQESTEIDKQNIPLTSIVADLVYEDVSFRFGKSGPLQLSKIDLEIKHGEFVALVGQSGSGKSTLAKLLTRLYEPDSGRILVDQYDISKVELYSLRSQIGIVPQDSLLFDGSVQDNILLSNPEASTADVIAAAKIACAHDFIMSLPNGYASSVGERGTALSGGQRQRIAIARTVLQNPRLLIMDEATSALDYQTERLVSLNLMDHFRGRTVLFITHRLSSIVHADKIVLMHQGSIEEVGSHDELISSKGRYYALFGKQDNS